MYPISSVLLFLIPTVIPLPETAPADSVRHEIGLQEITVTGTPPVKNQTGVSEGKIALTMKTLGQLPRFLGEADPVRTLQLMPGIQTAGEMNAGLYVRGCDPGHNLVLLNGAPVYNPMHMIGLFSIFNADHVSRFSLHHTAGNPLSGGRLGGTLEVTAPDTVATRFGMRAGVGLINAGLSLTLPVSKRSALYLSARRSYINYMLELMNTDASDFTLDYRLTDYNATYVWQPDEKNNITVNFYQGGDKLNIDDPRSNIHAQTRWANLAASLSAETRLARGKRLEQTLYYARFTNRIGLEQVSQLLQLPSSLWEAGYKGALHTRGATSSRRMGITYGFRDLDPQHPVIDGQAPVAMQSLFRTHETALFYGWKQYLGDRFSADASLRYTVFAQTGPYTRLFFDASDRPTGSYHKEKNRLVKVWHGAEPTVNLLYDLTPRDRLAASYELRRQYIHQVALSGIGFPIDFWVSASKYIPPQRMQSVTLGYFRDIRQGAWRFSAQLYGRLLANQAEFGGELFDMINQRFYFEEHLLFGKGRSYGAEFQLRKTAGALTGWISYTVGRSQRSFAGIEAGRWFDARHERRHDLSVVAAYRLSPRWELSSAFVYATGNSFTMPEKIMFINEKPVLHYGPYNGAKLAPYHRLDVSAQWTRGRSGVNISLYNAYARKNPVFLWVKVHQIPETGKMRIHKYGKSFYHLLPSVSYQYTIR